MLLCVDVRCCVLLYFVLFQCVCVVVVGLVSCSVMCVCVSVRVMCCVVFEFEFELCMFCVALVVSCIVALVCSVLLCVGV